MDIGHGVEALLLIIQRESVGYDSERGSVIYNSEKVSLGYESEQISKWDVLWAWEEKLHLGRWSFVFGRICGPIALDKALGALVEGGCDLGKVCGCGRGHWAWNGYI